ncbi:MAG: hypothetical protein N4A74_24475 [Carboxylicivirga sp.]|jgi:hypothetical protein|nr:hypothetical protein [Carboxylicivirga sp.]
MKYLLCLIIILFGLNSHAQQLKLSMEVGLGTYELNGLKAINDAVLSELPIKAKLVDDFPPHLYYRPSVSLVYNKIAWGFSHSYLSTGSRISTKDHTGEYRFDMIVSAHSPGLHFDFFLSQNSKISSYIRILTGAKFSRLNIDEYFKLAEKVHTNESIRFKSTNFFLEPAIYFTLPIKSFLFESHLGYDMSMGDNTLTDSSGERELANPKNGNAVPPNWNGVRIGIGVSYILGSK